jgi:hypothetical protein
MTRSRSATHLERPARAGHERSSIGITDGQEERRSLPARVYGGDNQGVVKFATSDGYTRRSKHMEAKYDYIKNNKAVNAVTLEYMPIGDMCCK